MIHKLSMEAKITGGLQGDNAGSSISSAGDVNGDGYADLIIGAPYAAGSTGAAYIIFGKPDGFVNINLNNFTLSEGFKVTSDESLGYNLGCSVNNAGDVNGDGYGDVIIGQTYTNSNAAYVIYGKKNGINNINLLQLTSTIGFKIYGASTGYYSCATVSNVGDLNKDGFSEVAVGTPQYNSYTGISYVIFGKQSGLTDIDVSQLSMPTGFYLYENKGVGCSMSAGDINKDGYSDIILNQSRYPYSPDRKDDTTYVIFGKASGFGNIVLSKLAMPDGFAIQNDHDGFNNCATVSGTGDVNNDGYADIILATNYNNGGYVIFGKQNGFNNINLSQLTMPVGFTISGGQGSIVTNAGDINQDGYSDIIIGAGSTNLAYLIYGKRDNYTDINLDQLTMPIGFKIQSTDINDNNFASAVNSVSNPNGDGYVMIGSPGFNTQQGITYLYSYSFLIPPTCNNTFFTAYTGNIEEIDFTKYISSSNIKLYSLPDSGSLLNNNKIATTGTIYPVNGLEYQAALSGSHTFGYTAINLPLESDPCIANINVPPTCNSTSFQANAWYNTNIDLTNYANSLNIKLYSLPNAGSLLNSNTPATIGGIYGVSALSYTASTAGTYNFNYTSFATQAESSACNALINVLPSCKNALFTSTVDTIKGTDLTPYINSFDIKLASLPNTGTLLNGNVPAVIGEVYPANVLQYQSDGNAGNYNFNFDAVYQSSESAVCASNIVVLPTCDIASFRVHTGSLNWIDFTNYIHGTINIKLYSLPNSGLLLYGNTLAKVGSTYGVNTLQYQSTETVATPTFNYAAIYQSSESAGCFAMINVVDSSDDSESSLSNLELGLSIAGGIVGLGILSAIGNYIYKHYPNNEEQQPLIGAVQEVNDVVA